MKCYRPIYLKSRGEYVPCGKCYACLSRRRNNWTIRAQEERKRAKACFFVTLTYSDDNLPFDDSVNYDDCQLFLKRLRRKLDYHFHCKMKYILVSEYGPNFSERPHYHALFFLNRKMLSEEFATFLRYSWKKGFIQCGVVSDARIHYVTGYIINLQDDDELHGRKKPFSLFSKGIGMDYVVDMMEYHNIENAFYQHNQYKYSLPRYWRDMIYSDAERAVLNAELQVENEMHPIHLGVKEMQNLEYKKKLVFKKHKKL